MLKDVFDLVGVDLGVAPIAQGASEVLSGAIDTLGMLGDAMVEVKTGAATGTPTSYSVACKVTECDTSGGSYADITGATATLAADGKHAQIRVSGLGTDRKRYIKISMTPSFTGGTSPKALVSAAFLNFKLDNPPANSSTAS